MEKYKIQFQKIESYEVEIEAANVDDAIAQVSDMADERCKLTAVSYDYYEEA